MPCGAAPQPGAGSEAAGLCWGTLAGSRTLGDRQSRDMSERSFGRGAAKSVSFHEPGGHAASAMAGCCTVAVSLEQSRLFPMLLQLSTKGKDNGSSFPRGHPRDVHCPKLPLLGCGGGWAGLGAALPEGPTGLRGQCGNQDSRVMLLGLPWVLRLPWEWLGALARGDTQGQLSLGAGTSLGSGSGLEGGPASRGCPPAPTGL